MGSKIEARVTHQFQASAEQVYDSWLDPVKIRFWMSAALKSNGLAGDIQRVEVDARVGSRFYFSDLRNGTEARHWGTYLTLDRPRKIVFTWIVNEADESDPSKVTLTIEPNGTGCLATIVHEMDQKWADYIDRVEGGWGRMLRAFDQLCESPK